jgi:hypothetical protein
MIAIPKQRRRRLTTKHQQMFLSMLPAIVRTASQSFSDLDPEGKEEAVAEVVAASYVMFLGLVQRGRESLAYPSVLALYGIKRFKIGRMTATPMNVKDISSTYCQLQKDVTVERLDRFGREEGWQEVLVEDRRSGPAEIAAPTFMAVTVPPFGTRTVSKHPGMTRTDDVAPSTRWSTKNAGRNVTDLDPS